MGSKRSHYVDGQVLTGNSTTTFDAFDVQNYAGFSFHIKPSGTGTLAGTVKVQVANYSGDWQDLSGASASLSTTTGLIINCSACYYGLARIAIVHTSGTSTIDIYAVAKES